MKNKCNKVKNTCGSPTYAECVVYESEVNNNSSLKEDVCFNIEETTQDIYTQLEEIDLSELGEICLEYVENDEGRNIVKNVLLKFEQEICNLKEKVENLENIAICEKSIVACDLDFGDLVPQCETSVTTLKDTLQLILDTIQPTT